MFKEKLILSCNMIYIKITDDMSVTFLGLITKWAWVQAGKCVKSNNNKKNNWVRGPPF